MGFCTRIISGVIVIIFISLVATSLLNYFLSKSSTENGVVDLTNSLMELMAKHADNWVAKNMTVLEATVIALGDINAGNELSFYDVLRGANIALVFGEPSPSIEVM